MSVNWNQVLSVMGLGITVLLVRPPVFNYQSTGTPSTVVSQGPGGTFNNAQQSHYIPGYGGGQGYPGIGGLPYG